MDVQMSCFLCKCEAGCAGKIPASDLVAATKRVTRVVRQLGQRWTLFIGFGTSYLCRPQPDSLIFLHLQDGKHTKMHHSMTLALMPALQLQSPIKTMKHSASRPVYSPNVGVVRL